MLRSTINKWDPMSLKTFIQRRILALNTEAVYRMENIAINWTSDSRLVSNTFKELKIK